MERPVHRSLVDQTVDSLREAILNGEFPPGTHLTERWLADQLNIGTIPVREAFTVLSHEGLIERVPRKGAFVTAPPFDAVKDLTDLREFLEVEAAARAAELWTAADDARATRALDGIREAVARNALVEVGEADAAFHAALAEASGSAVLAEFSVLVLSRLSRLVHEMRMDEETTGDLQRIVTIHEELLDAVRTRDPERARESMRQHVRSTKTRVEQAAERRRHLGGDPS